MSHVTCSKAIITDIDALEAACAKIPGLTFVRDKKTYKWWGYWRNDWENNKRQANLRGIDSAQFGYCDHVIRIDGAHYEVGVTQRKDGEGYQLVWDAWGNDGRIIDDAIGKEGEKLMAAYAEEVCRKHAEEQGLRMETTELDDGNLRIELIHV